MLHICISLYETKFHHVPHTEIPLRLNRVSPYEITFFRVIERKIRLKKTLSFSIGNRIVLYFWTYLWRMHYFWIRYININSICNFSDIFGFIYQFKMESCDFNCFHKWGNTISIICNRENLNCAWNIDILLKISAKKAGFFLRWTL